MVRQGKTSTGLNRVESCSYRTKFQLPLCVDRSYTDVREQDKMFQIHCSCSETWSNLVPLHYLLLPEEALASVPDIIYWNTPYDSSINTPATVALQPSPVPKFGLVSFKEELAKYLSASLDWSLTALTLKVRKYLAKYKVRFQIQSYNPSYKKVD